MFIEHQGGAAGADLERELFIVRKLIEREKAALGAAADDFYVCSLSNRTIVYKARRSVPLLHYSWLRWLHGNALLTQRT